MLFFFIGISHHVFTAQNIPASGFHGIKPITVLDHHLRDCAIHFPANHQKSSSVKFGYVSQPPIREIFAFRGLVYNSKD